MSQTELLFDMPSCTEISGIAAKSDELAKVSRNWARHRNPASTTFLGVDNVANALSLTGLSEECEGVGPALDMVTVFARELALTFRALSVCETDMLHWVPLSVLYHSGQ